MDLSVREVCFEVGSRLWGGVKGREGEVRG